MIERGRLENLIRSAWPYVRRIINDILFLIEKVIRGSIKTIMEQFNR